MKKAILVTIYIILIVLTFINKDAILSWIQLKKSSDIIPTLAAATILAIFPVIPYGVVAGIIGA